ncbi:uncharacterized protein LOC143293826 isoform X2 [Babylonia areolata]|uniref:uncharacterized protein LOC143293826 isoform X2 n=1 Tax=Babylonia areolata TaxID=304850 RepID=UPI003FD411A9
MVLHKKRGKNPGRAEGTREKTPDTQSHPADNTLLLADEEEKQRYLNSCRQSGGKALRCLRRAEGSLSMDSEQGDSDPPPAYTTHTPTPTPSNSHKGGPRRPRKTWWQRLLKLVKSLGGQAALLLAYTFLGAWMMMSIEGPREDAQRLEVNTARERTVGFLKNSTVALQTGAINDTEWDHRIRHTLLGFESQVHRSGVTSTSKKKWTFFGSVLFCFTTYTTIGYGNIAPATKAGRIATMLYATLGIPLALIVLADLGRRFAIVFKFLWGVLRRYYYTGYCRQVRAKAKKASTYRMNDSSPPPADPERGQGTDPLDLQRQGSYRKVDRSGDHPQVHFREEKEGGGRDGGGGEGDGGRKESERREGVDGGVTGSGAGRSERRDVRQRGSQDVELEDHAGRADSEGPHSTHRAGQHGQPQNPGTDQSDSADQADMHDEFQLPVPIAIGFIFAYIFLGAGMYRLWENWTYLESFYFVFITTSTIGFGDVLPEHPNFFLLSCVYTFFGLALVSMTVSVIMDFMAKTIDLAKHSVDHAKVRAVAKAKAARGVISQVGSKAKNKVRKTIHGRKGKKTRKTPARSNPNKAEEEEEEVGEESSEGSDAESDRVHVQTVQVSDAAPSTLQPSQADSAKTNGLKPASRTHQKTGGDIVLSDGAGSTCVTRHKVNGDTNTPRGHS